jgi:hypothetical protein
MSTRKKPKPRALDTELARLLPPHVFAQLDAYAAEAEVPREVVAGLAIVTFFSQRSTGTSDADAMKENLHDAADLLRQKAHGLNLEPGELVGGLMQFFR